MLGWNLKALILPGDLKSNTTIGFELEGIEGGVELCFTHGGSNLISHGAPGTELGIVYPHTTGRLECGLLKRLHARLAQHIAGLCAVGSNFLELGFSDGASNGHLIIASIDTDIEGYLVGIEVGWLTDDFVGESSWVLRFLLANFNR